MSGDEALWISQALLAALAGRPIPDACADCAGTDVIRLADDGVWELAVVHDPTCPTWRARRGHPKETP